VFQLKQQSEKMGGILKKKKEGTNQRNREYCERRVLGVYFFVFIIQNPLYLRNLKILLEESLYKFLKLKKY